MGVKQRVNERYDVCDVSGADLVSHAEAAEKMFLSPPNAD